MATEIVRWCDVCMTDDTRTAGTAHTVQLDGKTGDVDLCDQHGKQLLGPLSDFLRSGRGGGPGRTPVPGEASCPICRTSFRPGRVAPHLKKSHGVTAADVYGLTCPLCGFNANTSVGLTGHAARVHEAADGIAELWVMKARQG